MADSEGEVMKRLIMLPLELVAIVAGSIYALVVYAIGVVRSYVD